MPIEEDSKALTPAESSTGHDIPDQVEDGTGAVTAIADQTSNNAAAAALESILQAIERINELDLNQFGYSLSTIFDRYLPGIWKCIHPAVVQKTADYRCYQYARREVGFPQDDSDISRLLDKSGLHEYLDSLDVQQMDLLAGKIWGFIAVLSRLKKDLGMDREEVTRMAVMFLHPDLFSNESFVKMMAYNYATVIFSYGIADFETAGFSREQCAMKTTTLTLISDELRNDPSMILEYLKSIGRWIGWNRSVAPGPYAYGLTDFEFIWRNVGDEIRNNPDSIKQIINDYTMGQGLSQSYVDIIKKVFPEYADDSGFIESISEQASEPL